MATSSSRRQERNVARLADGAPDLIWNRPLAPGVKSCSGCLRGNIKRLENTGFAVDYEINSWENASLHGGCQRYRLFLEPQFHVSCWEEGSLVDEDVVLEQNSNISIQRSCAINGSIFAAREDILVLFGFIKKHAASLRSIPASVKRAKMALHEALRKTVDVELKFSKQMNRLMHNPFLVVRPYGRPEGQIKRWDRYKAELARRRDHFRLRGPFPYDGDVVEKRAWHLASLPRLLPADETYKEFHSAIDALVVEHERFLGEAARVVPKSIRDQMPPKRLLSMALRLRDVAHAESHSDTKPRLRNQESAAGARESSNKGPGTPAQPAHAAHRKPNEQPGQPTAKRIKREPQDRLPTMVSATNKKRKAAHAAIDQSRPDKKPRRHPLDDGFASTLTSIRHGQIQATKGKPQRQKVCVKPSLIPGVFRKNWL
ncbi:hypothetical protein PpBr36_01628 [Pyricularia pennisetigena]|uniref:hypothetical protein n=1 Tax=Pyricularia pennisetigena TaxID=1578925 RepID=UPI00114F4B45|nr:hypothetical protein PpBr36_01628 [Pyricularia pennisetigena]TLS27971.1 hypothetical protein PpBr36_01628 [Pyricularia pennisetigena]